MVDGKSAGGKPSSEQAKNAEKNTAKNIISKGICSACNSDKLDKDVVGIQCWMCKLYFHGTGCKEECNVSSNSDFTKLHRAVNNTGVFDGRFGRFLFVCDYCIFCLDYKPQITHCVLVTDPQLNSRQVLVKDREIKS